MNKIIFKILVPLPDPEARRSMFEDLLPPFQSPLQQLPYDFMVESTEGYSGSDIRLVCKEAAMRPLRRLMTILEEEEKEKDAGAEPTPLREEGRSVCLEVF